MKPARWQKRSDKQRPRELSLAPHTNNAHTDDGCRKHLTLSSPPQIFRAAGWRCAGAAVLEERGRDAQDRSGRRLPGHHPAGRHQGRGSGRRCGPLLDPPPTAGTNPKALRRRWPRGVTVLCDWPACVRSVPAADGGAGASAQGRRRLGRPGGLGAADERGGSVGWTGWRRCLTAVEVMATNRGDVRV